MVSLFQHAVDIAVDPGAGRAGNKKAWLHRSVHSYHRRKLWSIAPYGGYAAAPQTAAKYCCNCRSLAGLCAMNLERKSAA